MKKFLISFFSIVIGLGVLLVWDVGSFGPSLEFHSDRVTDWILLLVVITLFAIPLYFVVGWILKKLKKKE